MEGEGEGCEIKGNGTNGYWLPEVTSIGKVCIAL